MLLNKKLYYIVTLSIGLIGTSGFSTMVIPRPYLTAYTSHNPLILDAKDSFTFPRRFRTTSMPIPSTKLTHYLKDHKYLPSFQGYKDLRASGSAQFSRKNILAALSHMQGKVYVIDLRQESHGFLNGDAISWHGERNWANQGQTNSFISNLELSLFQNLISLKKASLCNFQKGFDQHLCPTASHDIYIKTAATEEQIIKELGLEYIRFPVLDRWRPEDKVIDQFVDFIKALPEGSWLHFHCRGGSGRTTTFLVMYDIIRNGHHVTLKDIIARHALAGVKNLQKISSVALDKWEAQGALKRLSVIEKFYEYVQDPDGYLSRSWTEWLDLKKGEFTS